MRIRRQHAVIAAVLVPLFAFSACGSDSSDDSSKPEAETSSSPSDSAEPTDEASEEASEETSTAPSAGEGTQPAWAPAVTKPGELLTTIKAGDVTVEVYQVGHAEAPKDGMFVDPDTNEPILKKGDDLIFVNYVITNNGAPIPLGSSLVTVDARYDDWKWMGGMDSSSDDDLFEAQGVNDDGVVPGTNTDPAIYTLGTGQSFSYGDNFEYQKDSPITFKVRYTPVDDEGDLDHDKRVEAEGATKIK